MTGTNEIQGDLLAHPAVAAWARLTPKRIRPDYVEELKRKNKSSVYRLGGLGPRGTAVIAKLAREVRATKERRIYEELLPHLPIASVRLLGFVEEDRETELGRFCWLFLEDIGNRPYSPFSATERTLLARWLGALHAAFEDAGVDASWLPDRGTDHFRNFLREAQAGLPEFFGDPRLGSEDRQVLRDILALCDAVAAHWESLERYCAGVPRTFIHGDFLAKNIHIKTRDGTCEVVPFDWGGAGRGLPAADLGHSALPCGDRFPGEPDYETYHAIVRHHWPSLSLNDLRQLAYLGQTLWSIDVVANMLPNLKFGWGGTKETMDKMKIFERVLRDSLRHADWAR